MSFRFPKNHIQFAGGETTLFNNVSELFNPAKNTLVFNSTYFNNVPKPTIADFLKTLKALTTRENLSDPEFLSFFLNKNVGGGTLYFRTIQAIIDGLTDNELPIMAFTTLSIDTEDYHGLTRETNLSSATFVAAFAVKVEHLDHTGNAYINGNHIELGLTTSNKICNRVGEAVQHVKECYRKFIGWLETTHSNKLWKFNHIQSRQSAFLNALFGYMHNTAYTRNNSGLNGSKFDQVYGALINYGFEPNEAYTLQFDIRPGRINVHFTEKPTERNRISLYKEFGYQTNVPDILSGKKKKDKEGAPTYIGIELEVSTEYSYKELIDAQDELFFICKHDSSITGSKPIKTELVTRVGSIKYLKERWAHFFSTVDYRKFDTSTNTNNGMHVHIGRDCFDDDFHIRNFAWMINNPANTPFMVALSERGSLEAMRQYASFTNVEGQRKTRGFRDIAHFCAGHRGALNFKGGINSKTVEVRIFKGIVSFAAILKNLEFIESLFEFSRSLRSYRKLNLQSYFEFVFKTPINKYPALKRFLEELNYEDFIVTAQMKELVANETDPERIAKILNNSDIPLTNEHITILNKGKKRVFYLDDGVIKLVDYNSKLASLDKQLADRFFLTKKKALPS